jgi:hypothetical protein
MESGIRSSSQRHGGTKREIRTLKSETGPEQPEPKPESGVSESKHIETKTPGEESEFCPPNESAASDFEFPIRSGLVTTLTSPGLGLKLVSQTGGHMSKYLITLPPMPPADVKLA